MRLTLRRAGLIRGLIYPIQVDHDPQTGIDRVLDLVVARAAMDGSPEEYVEAVREALGSDDPLAQLIPQDHSEKVIRRYLEETAMQSPSGGSCQDSDVVGGFAWRNLRLSGSHGSIPRVPGKGTRRNECLRVRSLVVNASHREASRRVLGVLSRTAILCIGIVFGGGCDDAKGTDGKQAAPKNDPSIILSGDLRGPGWHLPGTASPAAAPVPPVAPGETMLWKGAPQGKKEYGGLARWRWGGEPIGLDVDGDGIEEAVGFVSGGARNAPLFPAIIDAKTVRPRWVGPAANQPTEGAKRSDFVEDGEADPAGVFIEAWKRTIVVTTHDGRILLFDPSGDQAGEKELTSRAYATCVPNEDTIRVVLENDSAIDVDLPTRVFRDSKDGCPAPMPTRPSFDEEACTDLPQLRSSPRCKNLPPWRAKTSWHEGGKDDASFHITVSGGELVKDVDRMKREARVSFFEKGKKEPLWTTILGDDAPVALPRDLDLFATDGEEVFAETEKGKVVDRLEWPEGTNELTLTSLDLRTGAVRWLSRNPRKSGSSSGWLITKQYLFVARPMQLDVFERATGKSMGYMGWH